MKNYTSSWNIPLFGGREKARSEMVAGQLQGIDKVADEFDLEQYHNDILLDVYGSGVQKIGTEDLEDVEYGNHSIIRADVEYGDEEPHIGASYTRTTVVSPQFMLEATGTEGMRNQLEEEVGENLTLRGWRGLLESASNMKEKALR